MRLCPKSHPCSGKHLLVAVTQLCTISASPAHGGYPLKSKSAARLWSSTFHVNIWRSNIWPDGDAWCASIYFCYKGFSAGDKSRWTWMLSALAYVQPWASHLGHPYLRALEWDNDLQLGMKDNPRAAARAGTGFICSTEVTHLWPSASWIIISDIAKPIWWWIKWEKEKEKKKRLEQRERAKMVGSNCVNHKVVSRRGGGGIFAFFRVGVRWQNQFSGDVQN